MNNFLERIKKGIIAYQKKLLGPIDESFVSSTTAKRNVPANPFFKKDSPERKEFVICGLTLPKKEKEPFNSIMVGYYVHSDQIVYCGNVSQGFSSQTKLKLYKLLRRRIAGNSYFCNLHYIDDLLFWTKPEIIIEVEFDKWFLDGMLVNPKFKGVRFDMS